MVLCTFYPEFTLLFQVVVALDISSHWMQMYSSLLHGENSHKVTDLSANPFMRLYYSRVGPTLALTDTFTGTSFVCTAIHTVCRWLVTWQAYCLSICSQCCLPSVLEMSCSLLLSMFLTLPLEIKV